MRIIPSEPEKIKASDDFNVSDIDVTATEFLNLQESVVESYKIADQPEREVRC